MMVNQNNLTSYTNNTVSLSVAYSGAAFDSANYTVSPLGGTITVSGSSLGVVGALAANENITITTNYGTFSNHHILYIELIYT